MLWRLSERGERNGHRTKCEGGEKVSAVHAPTTNSFGLLCNPNLQDTAMHIEKHKTGLKLSLTKDDFDWDYFTCGGHGGQNVQKTATGVRCTHRPSGAVAVARDERSQIQNKRLAFSRCTASDKFRFWAKMELARAEERETGQMTTEQRVNQDMAPGNIRVEVLTASGWQPEK